MVMLKAVKKSKMKNEFYSRGRCNPSHPVVDQGG